MCVFKIRWCSIVVCHDDKIMINWKVFFSSLSFSISLSHPKAIASQKYLYVIATNTRFQRIIDQRRSNWIRETQRFISTALTTSEKQQKHKLTHDYMDVDMKKKRNRNSRTPQNDVTLYIRCCISLIVRVYFSK